MRGSDDRCDTAFADLSWSPAVSHLALMAWISPAFPVGAFAYSHGLEAACETGDITDASTLQAWLTDLIADGSGRSDAVIAAAAWDATSCRSATALQEVNDLALALSPARERRFETAAMGNAFATTIRAAWPDAVPASWPDRDVAYPVAFGSACAAGGVVRSAAVEAFLLAFVQNLVSAAVRLGPIGQTDGQKVTAALLPVLHAVAATLSHATLDDVGGCAHRSDIAAMRHETLYSRLFRS